MKAWFVSDIHISDQKDPKLARFESFLRARLTDGTTHLFLVGDIFDLWVGGDDFFANRYSGVVALIRDLRSRGVEVVYFEGNHDLHLQDFWSATLDCRVETAPQYFNLGSSRVRVEHGDQMNPDDTGYLFLRRFLRTDAMTALVRALPGSMIQAIGNSMSRSSRRWTSWKSNPVQARNIEAIRKMIRTHAELVSARDESFDLMVSGHVHIRDDFSWRDSGRTSGAAAAAREIRSVNLGSWLGDEPPQAFVLEDGAGRWVAV